MKKYLVLMSMLLLLCGAAVASAGTIGNDIIDRTEIDGAINIAFIDPTLVFPTAGILDSWSFWARGYDRDLFATQIYRYTGTDDDWELVYHEAYMISGTVDKDFLFPTSTTFNVEAGDVIGWWFGAGAGTIPFTYTGNDDVGWSDWNKAPYTNPTVGDIVDFNTSWANSFRNREYSIAANYTPVPEPATMLLLGAGLLGLAGLGRKFRKS